MSSEYGSGAPGSVGGNKPASDAGDMAGQAEPRFGTHQNSDPYSGGTEYGSGTTGGAGFGNKSSGDANAEYDRSDTRFGSHLGTAPYSGGTEHGSGSTGGPGVGNKTGSFNQDSTTGKLMEKAGGVLNKESLVEKGRAKRESAGHSFEES